jgi:hypothetical protein
MKLTTTDTKHQQQPRRRKDPSFGQKNMDATALATASSKKAFLLPPPKRRSPSPPRPPSPFLVECDDSSSTELDVLSLDRLPEVVKRRFSGEGCYGYEPMEMDHSDYADDGSFARLSKSDSAIVYHDHPFNRDGGGEEKETPRTKRRRLMNRRNSQTPAMLVASSATVFLANGGFGDILDRGIDVDAVLNMSLMSLASTTEGSSTEISADETPIAHHRDSVGSDLIGLGDSLCWSKGVEIAEELVKHLQRRV